MNVILTEIVSVYCTAEEGCRAWTDGADSGAVGVWHLVHHFLVSRFKQENLLTLQVGIHTCRKKWKYYVLMIWILHYWKKYSTYSSCFCMYYSEHVVNLWVFGHFLLNTTSFLWDYLQTQVYANKTSSWLQYFKFYIWLVANYSRSHTPKFGQSGLGRHYSPREHAIADPTIPPPDIITS